MIYRTFRLFISSTFENFGEERRILNQEVAPKMRSYCQARGYDFEIIDLRWGVSSEAALNQNTMEICLGEIRRCKEYSPRPNFLVMQGERYGWVPLPSSLSTDEYEPIFLACDGEDRKLLDEWYLLDENVIGGAYVLERRTGRYVDDKVWAETEAKIRTALFSGMDKAGYGIGKKKDFDISATEREINEGLFKNGGLAGNAIAFIRDSTRPCGEDARVKLLKRRIQRKMVDFPDQLIYTDDGEGYLDYFKTRILEQLPKMIDQEIRRLDSEKESQREECGDIFVGRDAEMKALADYLSENSHNMLAVVGNSGTGKSTLLRRFLQQQKDYRVFSVFYGQDDNSYALVDAIGEICEQIITYLNEKNGSSPMGELKADTDSPEGNGMSHTMKYVMGGIGGWIFAGFGNKAEDSKTVEKGIDEKLPSRVGEYNLAQGFQDTLLALTGEKVLIVIDALEMFSDIGQINENIFPEKLPDGVRLVVSSANMDVVTKYCPEDTEKMLLGRLSDSNAWMAFDGRMQKKGRTLSNREQVMAIRWALSGGSDPLTVKILSEIAQRWHSYDKVSLISVKSEADAHLYIEETWERLGHDRAMVLGALCLVGVSPYGVAENELLELLPQMPDVRGAFRREDRYGNTDKALPYVVWSRLFYDLGDCLETAVVKGTTVIRFGHGIFETMLRERYANLCDRALETLISYYDGQDMFYGDAGGCGLNGRRALILPELLKKAGRKIRLADLYTDAEFVDSQIRVGELQRTLTMVAGLLRSEDRVYVRNRLERMFYCLQQNRERLLCYRNCFLKVFNEIGDGDDGRVIYYPYGNVGFTRWTPDGCRYAIGSGSYLSVWDRESGTELSRVFFHGKKLYGIYGDVMPVDIAWTDNDRLVVLTNVMEVLGYRIGGGKLICEGRYGLEDDGFREIRLVPQRSILLCRAWDGVVAFDVNSFEKRYEIPTNMCMSMCVSQDGKCLSLSEHKSESDYVRTIREFAVETGEELEKFEMEVSSTKRLCAYTGDGGWILENLEGGFAFCYRKKRSFDNFYLPYADKIQQTFCADGYMFVRSFIGIFRVELDSGCGLGFLNIPYAYSMAYISGMKRLAVNTNAGIRLFGMDEFVTEDEGGMGVFKTNFHSISNALYARKSAKENKVRKWKNEGGLSPSHMRSYRDMSEMVAYFYSAGADYGDSSKIRLGESEHGATFVSAAKNGCLAVAYETADLIMVYDGGGKPILKIAGLRFSHQNPLRDMEITDDGEHLTLTREYTRQTVNVKTGKIEKKQKYVRINAEYDEYNVNEELNLGYSRIMVYEGGGYVLVYRDGEFYLHHPDSSEQIFDAPDYDFALCLEMEIRKHNPLQELIAVKNDLTSRLIGLGNGMLLLVCRRLSSLIVFDVPRMRVCGAYRHTGSIIGFTAYEGDDFVTLYSDVMPFKTDVAIPIDLE